MTGRSDLISLLRASREHFFPAGTCVRANLTAGIVADAVGLGAANIQVDASAPPWTIVSADANWLRSGLTDDSNYRHAFTTQMILPGSESSPYFRHEPHLLAFADAVSLWVDGACEVMSGSRPPYDVLNKLRSRPFGVIFAIDVMPLDQR